jgi:hypothetical protein
VCSAECALCFRVKRFRVCYAGCALCFRVEDLGCVVQGVHCVLGLKI